MPAITVDGQSFTFNGHRLWLVSGSLPYYRSQPSLWGARLDAAVQAGLNCVLTPVPWSLHEPRPGSFRFNDDLDLPAFLRQVAARKMRCILRLGPYIGDGMDMGGLPVWLLPDAAGKLRSGAPEFLAPVSRYLAVVCEKIREFQATYGRKGGGPIVAVQNEHQWLCGHQAQGEAYLGELNRFIREHGVTVPILSANNLYYTVEGEIDAWSTSQHLHANMRQLREIRPDQPRIVVALSASEPACWGHAHEEQGAAWRLMRRIGEALAAGAQFNVAPFFAGAIHEFQAGRTTAFIDGFTATSPAPGAVLGETGRRGDAYLALKRIAPFASSFGRVLAALDPASLPAMLSLDGAPHSRTAKADAGAEGAGLAVLERRGTQGAVIFVFAPLHGQGRGHRATVLLRDGSTLPVDLGQRPVAWLLFDTHLAGRATLDYCNLCAHTMVGSVLVVYGVAGSPGLLSINGSAFEVIVPEGTQPHIEQHHGVTVVVCSEEQIDACYASHDAVYVGASGLDESGAPIPHPDYKKIVRISAEGEAKVSAAPTPARPAPAPALRDWSVSVCDAFVEGTSDRFAAIDGPAPMQRLGAPYGYGWLRLRLKSSASRSVKLGLFEAADRLHLYLDGGFAGLIGAGPGASGPVLPLRLKQGERTITALIDNLGRPSDGNHLDEEKGLFGHPWEVKPLRVPAPKIEVGKPIDPFSFRLPIFGLEEGDQTDGRRVTWKFKHPKRTPIFMEAAPYPEPAVVLLDGQPIGLLRAGTGSCIVFQADRLPRGAFTIQVAVVGDVERAHRHLKESARFYDGVKCLTDGASWAFAKWEPPPSSYRPAPEAGRGGSLKGRPVWWRTSFRLDAVDGPLWLEARGLSKGQIYVNGRNAGRYFVATRTGRAVPPQSRYLLPEPWLKAGQNDLVLFDEHGFTPEKASLTRD